MCMAVRGYEEEELLAVTAVSSFGTSTDYLSPPAALQKINLYFFFYSYNVMSNPSTRLLPLYQGTGI